MSRFEIAFSGQLVAGARPEVVKANLAKLFQADAQRIELLFSGRRVVIKNNLDAASAEKYRSVLERAGAIAVVAEMEIEEVVMAPPPAQTTPVEAPPGRGADNRVAGRGIGDRRGVGGTRRPGAGACLSGRNRPGRRTWAFPSGSGWPAGGTGSR